MDAPTQLLLLLLSSMNTNHDTGNDGTIKSNQKRVVVVVVVDSSIVFPQNPLDIIRRRVQKESIDSSAGLANQGIHHTSPMIPDDDDSDSENKK